MSTARRSGLGRGLGALLPTEVINDQNSKLLSIPTTQLKPSSLQPRSYFDEEALASLAASVKELGVLQPILVRPLEDGGEEYEIIAGERRWRAAKRAGLPSVPAIVQVADDISSLERALVENLHREDLNALEEAAAYQQLIEDFELTHEQVAMRVGKSRAAVTNSLRLFQLPPAIQKAVSNGQIGAGHARALLGTPDRAFQEELARRIVEEDLSVRAVEEAIRGRGNSGSPTELGERDDVDQVQDEKPASAEKRLRPPGLLELEELLAQHLDTRVKVEMSGKKGKVVVEFADLADLERVYRIMTAGI